MEWLTSSNLGASELVIKPSLAAKKIKWKLILYVICFKQRIFGLGLACQAECQSIHTNISTPVKAFTENPE